MIVYVPIRVARHPVVARYRYEQNGVLPFVNPRAELQFQWLFRAAPAPSSVEPAFR